MKSFLQKTLFILSAALILFSCEDSYDSLVDDRLDENPPPDAISASPGSADFSNYVAIGTSITAGFMDGALYNLGQDNSLGAHLARQFQLANGGSFEQPDISAVNGFNTLVENPQNGTVLGRFKLDTDIPGPSPTIPGDPLTAFSGDISALNNFGIPGIVVGQMLTPATGGPDDPANPAFNPFYARMATQPGASTIIGDILAAQPSFFTLWIGSNDVLGYAVSGASNPALLTSEADFNNQFNAVVGQLMNNTAADGVVVTVPLVTLTPFFQAVPYNVIELSQAEADQLNQNFAGLNAALDAVAANFPQHSQADMDARKVNYQAGANPILVNDPTLDDLEDEFDALGLPPQQRAALVPYEQSRPLTQGELVTLTAGSVIGTLADQNNPQSIIGVVVPLGLNSAAAGDEFYLTLSEQNTIQSRIAAFNTTIATAVAGNSDRLALYDINSGFPGNPNTELSVFADLFGMDGELGIRISGTELQPDFSPNGVFSTDGIHPNPRGVAILANDIIEAVEQNFGASIPRIEVLNLPSVQLCAGDCVSQQPSVAGSVNTTY